MKVLLYARHGHYPTEIESLVKSFGLEIVKASPEVVITYGGDGTILGAEENFPTIPKLALRADSLCHLCSLLPNKKLLATLASNELKTQEFLKLEASVNGQTITALNDIIIAHKLPNLAIRFEIFQKKYIGDGLVISTPFGSTGYFYSITHNFFNSGLGIAFNNIHNEIIKEKIVEDSTKITISITRGPAVLASDNSTNLININNGDKILVKKSSQVATFLTPAAPSN